MSQQKGTTDFLLEANTELEQGNETQRQETIKQIRGIIEALYKVMADRMNKFEFLFWYRMVVIGEVCEKENITLHGDLDVCFIDMIQSSIARPTDLAIYIKWLFPQLKFIEVNPLEDQRFLNISMNTIADYISEENQSSDQLEAIQDVTPLLLPYIEKAKTSPIAKLPALPDNEEDTYPKGTVLNVLQLFEEVLHKLSQTSR